jgi:LacI family transcriptional regulator
VVGFDDAAPTGAGLGLTTVRQPHRGKGEHAARALLSLIAGSEPAGRPRMLPTELVVRASTAPPAHR